MLDILFARCYSGYINGYMIRIARQVIMKAANP